MEIAKAYSREIISFIVPLVTAAILWVFKARPSILWSVHNPKMFQGMETVTQADGTSVNKPYAVRVSSLFVQNSGREAAKNVEIVYNWRPQYFNLWLQRDYTTSTNPENRFIFNIPSLGPKEFVGIDILSVDQDLPLVIQVRSEGGPGNSIKMFPQRIYPRWVFYVSAYLLFCGLAATVYLAIALLQFAVLRSP